MKSSIENMSTSTSRVKRLVIQGLSELRVLLCTMQVIKVSPYALPAAHRDLLDISRSLNRRSHGADANATSAY